MTREQMIDMAVRLVACDWVGPHTGDILDHFFDPSAGARFRMEICREFAAIYNKAWA